MSDSPISAGDAPECRPEAVGSPAATCDCIARVNADLKERAPNTRIVTNLFGTPKCLVSTYQVKTGRGMKKASLLMASFCPFCGIAYAQKPEAGAQS